jgi:hypothetical protein
LSFSEFPGSTVGYLKDGFESWKKAGKEVDTLTELLQQNWKKN